MALISYYPANEGAGTQLLDVYGGIDLTCENGNVAWNTGHGDNEYAFDPYTIESKRVMSADDAFASLFVNGAMSICWWVYSPIHAFGSIIKTPSDFHVVKDDAGYHNINGSSTYQSSAIALSEWHHVALVLDGSTFQWYIDGVADLNGTFTFYDSSMNGVITFGGYDEIYFRYRGYINDLYLFNSAIDQATVQACMNNTLFGSTIAKHYYNILQGRMQ